MELKIGNIYKITKKIGQGAFGEIYSAINIENNKEHAVKIEPLSCRHPQLKYEAKFLKFLNSDPLASNNGITKIYYEGTEGENNVLVMEILKSNLEDLFKLCEKKFSLKTVLMLADQMISRIEYLHSKMFIHRDIKPENFMIGEGKNMSRVYLIDFGLAKRYMSKEGQHIPQKDNKSLTGTARYVSINTHLGLEQSRRDDMEALGYVFLYFLRGSLPWQDLNCKNKTDKYERILEKKISTKTEILCKGYPSEFSQYLDYIKVLKFDDKPDYTYCKNLFNNLMIKLGYQYDDQFDWIKIQSEQKAEVAPIQTEEKKELDNQEQLAAGNKESCNEESGKYRISNSDANIVSETISPMVQIKFDFPASNQNQSFFWKWLGN